MARAEAAAAAGSEAEIRKMTDVPDRAAVDRLKKFYRDMLLDPPFRGEGGSALRHGTDRRILPSLYRPGSGRGRHAGRAAPGRSGHHHLSRSRPHARLRHGPGRCDGRAHRTRHGLLEGQGRLDAHVQPREELLRRSRHRGCQCAHRHGARLRQPLPQERRGVRDLFRRRRRQPGPGLRVLQHGRAVEAAGHLCDREQPVRDGNGRRAVHRRNASLQARRLAQHSGRSGRRHGCRGRACCGRESGGLGARGQRSASSSR